MASATSDPTPFNPITTLATDLIAGLENGTLTSVAIVDVYLAQIEAHNHAGMKLRAMISVTPRDVLIRIAQNLDDERKAGKVRGRLHGLPFVVKV